MWHTYRMMPPDTANTLRRATARSLPRSHVALTVAQVVGGIVSGSLARIADALHTFSDAASLVIAVRARRIARRPADTTMTLGYGRAGLVAAPAT